MGTRISVEQNDSNSMVLAYPSRQQHCRADIERIDDDEDYVRSRSADECETLPRTFRTRDDFITGVDQLLIESIIGLRADQQNTAARGRRHRIARVRGTK